MDDNDDTGDIIEEMVRTYDKKTLGKVLNALDGIITNHGRIIILTTNHKEVLDPALVRPGRIDLQLELGYLCSETLNSLLARFFPDYKKRDLSVKAGISPVFVQNDIILGLTESEIIHKYTTTENTFNIMQAIK